MCCSCNDRGQPQRTWTTFFTCFLVSVVILLAICDCHAHAQNVVNEEIGVKNPSRQPFRFRWKRSGPNPDPSVEGPADFSRLPTTSTSAPALEPPLTKSPTPDHGFKTTTVLPSPELVADPGSRMQGRSFSMFGINIGGGGRGRYYSSEEESREKSASKQSGESYESRERNSGGLLGVNLLGGGGSDSVLNLGAFGDAVNVNVIGGKNRKHGSLVDVDVLGSGCNKGGNALFSLSILTGSDCNDGSGGNSGSRSASRESSGSSEESFEKSVINSSPEDSSEESEERRRKAHGRGRGMIKVNIDLYEGHHAQKPKPTDKVIRCNSTYDIMKHPDDYFIVQSQHFGTKKQYPAGTSCRWVLKGSKKCVVELQCHKIDIRGSCQTEFLEFYDDGVPRGVKRLCRKTSMKKTIKAHSGHNLNVLFQTSSSKKFSRFFKGFQCKAQCSEDPDIPAALPVPKLPPVQATIGAIEVCGVDKEYNIATIRKIVVTSQRETKNNKKQKPVTCSVFISGSETCRVQATCEKLDLRSSECSKEYVKLYDGRAKKSKKNVKLCDKKSRKAPFLSMTPGKNNGILVETKFYAQYTKSGHLGMRCMFECKPVIMTTPPPIIEAGGVPTTQLCSTQKKHELGSKKDRSLNIQSLKYGSGLNYPTGQSCLIDVIGDATCTVQIICKNFDFRPEQCENEHLEIFDSIQTSVKTSTKLCGSTLITKPYVARKIKGTNGLRIVMTTSAKKHFNRVFKGFSCKVTCVEDDKKESTTQLCSVQKKYDLGSKKGRSLNVQSLKYESGSNYPTGQSCLIDVIGDATCTVQIVCNNFDFRPKECPNEHLEIFDSIQTSGRTSTKLCGSTLITKPYVARKVKGTNGLQIVMTTSAEKHFSRVFKGFNCKVTCVEDEKVEVTTQLCSVQKKYNLGSKKGRSLNVQSLKYGTGSNYPTGQSCLIDVIGDATCTVQIVCKNFDFRPEECQSEHVEIFNSIQTSGRASSKLCGSTLITEPYVARNINGTNGLRIVMTTSAKTKFSRVFRGFSCKVTCTEDEQKQATTTKPKVPPPQSTQITNTPKAQLCSTQKKYELGSKKNRSLNVQSLKYGSGSNYPTGQSCLIDVIGDATCTVQIVCNNFDFRPEQCGNEHLEIFNSIQASSGPSTKLCGSTLITKPYVARKIKGTNGLRIVMTTSDKKKFSRVFKGFSCKVTCAEDEKTQNTTAKPETSPSQTTRKPNAPKATTTPKSESLTKTSTTKPSTKLPSQPTKTPTTGGPITEEQPPPPSGEPLTQEPMTETVTEEPGTTTEPSTTTPAGPQCHYRIQGEAEFRNKSEFQSADICNHPERNLTVKPGYGLRVHSTNFVEDDLALENYLPDRDCKLFIYGNEDCLIHALCHNVDLRRFSHLGPMENCTRDFIEIYDGFEDWRNKITLCHGTVLREPYRASLELQEGMPNGMTIRFKTEPGEFTHMYDGFICVFSCEIRVCGDEPTTIPPEEQLDSNVLETIV